MRLLTCIAVFLGAAAGAAAQTSSASVVGRVTDATGAVIPGVAIKITNLDTNISQPAPRMRSGTSPSPICPPGGTRWRPAARDSAPTSAPSSRWRWTRRCASTSRSKSAPPRESVTVTDTPPALNTESGARGEVTTNEEIAEMPLDGRNFADLAYLTGGVIPKGDGGDGALRGQRRARRQLRLPHRRHEQYPAAQYRRGDQSAARRRAGVQDDHLGLLRRIRPLCRRRAERGHQERDQPPARLALRVHAQRRVRRAELLRRREVQAAPQSVRRHGDRPGLHPQAVRRAEPHVSSW